VAETGERGLPRFYEGVKRQGRYLCWFDHVVFRGFRVGAISFGFLTRGQSSSGADFNCLEKE